MRRHEELARLLREANPVPDAHDRFEDSHEAHALSLLVEERRVSPPLPSDPNASPHPQPKRTSAGRPAVAFAGATAAVVAAFALVLLLGNGTKDAGGAPTSGTISISIQDWSGVEGYRLLAGVWEANSAELVGGAFWIIIESDPFSGRDVVHPPNQASEKEGESWGATDYLWEETVELEPGKYRIDFWANPGELKPYGSHIPAGPIERHCSVEVEVAAGESAEVVISGVPKDGPCRQPASSESSGTIAITVEGIRGRPGWALAGVLYEGAGISDPDHRVIGGFAAEVEADPFSTTRFVFEPDDPEADGYDGRFPFVTDDVLAVEPGTYTLVLWLGPDLGPYSRWVPADTAGLVGCEASVEVAQGQDVTVRIAGGLSDPVSDLPECARVR